MTATLTKWYEAHGRHAIFAGNKDVPLPSSAHSLAIREGAVAAGAQVDLDERGIPKNARDEQLHARMAELYRQQVLKEPPTLAIQGLGKRTAAPAGPLLGTRPTYGDEGELKSG